MRLSERANPAPLDRIVAGVLGDLAFMAEDPEDFAMPPRAEWLCGEVGYRGNVTGRLRCWCTTKLAVTLAANLLGCEPSDVDARDGARDAVREFMNVLCGQLVTHCYGTHDVFALSIPQVAPAAPPDLRNVGEGACRLMVAGQPFLCAHESSGPGPEAE